MAHKILFTICLVIMLCIASQAQEAKRIVSLAASITRNLTELGVKERIIGCTRYCIVDAKKNIPVVADAVNINLEKIALLKPDIVITSGLTHPRTIEALKKMGIRTVQYKQPQSFNEICEQFIQLAEITGQQKIAKTILDQCKERLTTVNQQYTTTNKPKVFMEIGNNPLYAALPNTFMSDYIVLAGGKNIVENMTNGNISKEFVLLQNPDVILITAMGISGDTEKANWQKLNFLKAVQKNKIFTLPDEICSPTPVSFVMTVESLVPMLHGKK